MGMFKYCVLLVLCEGCVRSFAHDYVILVL